MATVKDALVVAAKCVSLLAEAAEWAETATAAWKEATGNEYGLTLQHYNLSHTAEETWLVAAKAAIRHMRNERFPDLPFDADAEARLAADEGIALPDVPEWFAAKVGPTAAEIAWQHMLVLARATVPRVGEWSENRREAKLSGRRLSLKIQVWSNTWRKAWDNRAWDWDGELRGLEAVIRYADGIDFGLGVRGTLFDAARQQIEPGQDLTHWAACSQIRTFKNGRFDIWLRDEELAGKVKAMLEGNDD